MRLQNRGANEFFLPLIQVARAQRMIEDYDSRSSRLAFDQLFDLRVINGLQLILIEKIRDLRLVLDKDKALLVQRKPLAQRPAVKERHCFQLDRSRPSSVNIFRAEGFVDKS